MSGISEKGLSKLGLAGEVTMISSTEYYWRPIPETDVLVPSDMIMIGDSAIITSWPSPPWPKLFATDGISPGSGIFLVELGLLPLYPGYQGDAMTSRRRHRGCSNVVFCDSHVETLKPDDLHDLRRDDVARRWNNDNLPHFDLQHVFHRRQQ